MPKPRQPKTSTGRKSRPRSTTKDKTKDNSFAMDCYLAAPLRDFERLALDTSMIAEEEIEQYKEEEMKNYLDEWDVEWKKASLGERGK